MSGGVHGIQLQHENSKAKEMVKLALDYTNIISNYWVSKHQIVAKTGTSFPRILWSYGETLYIDFNELPGEKITPISVYGEKEVSVNIGGNPEKVKRAFLANLDFVRGLEPQELESRLRDANSKARNNQNRSPQRATQAQQAPQRQSQQAPQRQSQQAPQRQSQQAPQRQSQQAPQRQSQQAPQRQSQQATRRQSQQAPQRQSQQATRRQSQQATRRQPQQNTSEQHQNMHSGKRGKQVQSPNQLSNGTNSLFKIMIIIIVVSLILTFLIFATIPQPPVSPY